MEEKPLDFRSGWKNPKLTSTINNFANYSIFSRRRKWKKIWL